MTDPEVPRLIQSIYGIPAPATPRNDQVEIFLTGLTTKANGPIKANLNSQLNNADVDTNKFQPSEILRLNLSTPVTANPNRLGVLAGDNQGFPNGRRLTDDVVDIELQALEGAAQTGKLVDALAAGDGVNANDNAFGKSFPYVALPNVGAVNKGGGTAAGAAYSGDGHPGEGATPSTMPAALETGSGQGSNSVTTMALTASSSAGAAALLVGGVWWLRRRSRPGIPIEDTGPDDTPDHGHRHGPDRGPNLPS